MKALILIISLTILTSCVTVYKVNNFYFENPEVRITIELSKGAKNVLDNK